MADILETKTLLAAIEQIPPAHTFLRDKFFPGSQTHNTRVVEIDVVKAGRKQVPYVSPVQEGIVMTKAGFKTQNLTMPYIKIKYDVSAVEALKRQPGENPYSARTPDQRAQEILGKRLQEGKRDIARAIELQAAQALATGKVTLAGVDENNVSFSIEVDFGRDAELTITHLAAAYWTVDAVNPLDDLRTYATLVRQKSGFNPGSAVMGEDALKAFLNNPNVKSIMDTRRFNRGEINMTPYDGQGVSYVGTADGFDIYSYSEWYRDGAGAEQPMVPANGVILGSAGARNIVHYGAIVDLETGGANIEREIYAKSWLQQDPSVRWLLAQSSPLATLHHPDSCAFITVVA